VIRSKPIDAERLLRDAGLKCTRGRVAILEVLGSTERPMTREEIAARIGRKSPDKVTIYRALERFVEVGIVHRAFMQRRAWHFELAHNCTESQCHPHFTCTDCGTTHCLTEMTVPLASSPHNGFVIDRQRVQLEGLCPECV
jgi:Fur family ferric uptake transcriptional regulator